MKQLLRRLRSQSAQSLTEFALISPLLFLFICGIIDFGRVIYIQDTLNQAANEGARTAIRGEPPDYGPPTDTTVEASVQRHAQGVYLANPCPNGPIPATPVPPANQGWIFITEAPPPTSFEATPPMNGPGGGAGGAVFGAGCNLLIKASNQAPLQVTVYYNFQPITPLLQQVAANHIVLSAYAVYRTEY
jgi:hypothetical protein